MSASFIYLFSFNWWHIKVKMRTHREGLLSAIHFLNDSSFNLMPKPEYLKNNSFSLMFFIVNKLGKELPSMTNWNRKGAYLLKSMIRGSRRANGVT